MKTKIMAALLALAPLGACQTIEQAGETEAQIVCTEGGYGPGMNGYEACVRQLKPTAIRLEQRRRAELISQGAAQIARGLNPPETGPKITCVQTGTITQCY